MSKIKKGDSVIVIAGKDKTKTGKVLNVLAPKNKIIVEGVNLVKKHRRRRKQEDQAGIIETESPLHLSNVLLYCPKCKKGTRAGFDNSRQANKKRICKKCQGAL